jgi:hypothetical protein
MSCEFLISRVFLLLTYERSIDFKKITLDMGLGELIIEVSSPSQQKHMLKLRRK